ncbi:MAG: radical SAM protein [Candidatus Heimdallarchaeota archaeon]
MAYAFVKQCDDSKWFGKRLHVNFFKKKTCTFDCVYCEDGPTNTKVVQRVHLFPASRVFEEISDHIEKNGEPDYVWYSCMGEPTLCLALGDLNKMIKENFPKVKIGSWTNCTLLYRKDVREELSTCDFVIADLDSVNDNDFYMINQPHEKIKLDLILASLKQFREEYKGKLWIHSVFIKGYNDSPESIDALIDYLKEVNPTSYYVSLPNRFSPLAENFKETLEEKLAKASIEVVFD